MLKSYESSSKTRVRQGSPGKKKREMRENEERDAKKRNKK